MKSRILFPLLSAFTLACALGACPSIYAQDNPAPHFAQRFLQTFLKNREGQYVLNVGARKIEIMSGTRQQWLGKYEIVFDPLVTEAPSGALTLNTERVVYRGIPVVRIVGQLKLPMPPVENADSLLRSLFRADPLLHPMLKFPGGKLVLADAQMQVLDQLKKYRETAVENYRPTKAIVIVPTGFGKTAIAGEFAKSIISSSSKPTSIVFVVQNREILDDASQRLAGQLGLKPTEVRRVYGDTAKELVAPGETKLIAMSRTAMHRNLNELLQKRKAFQGNVIFIFDEAHHLGKVDGEFNVILNAIDAQATADDIILGLTATPWHSDADLIEKVFENHVATALLTEQEKLELLRSRKLIYMSRLMLFRAMSQGYLSPIQGYRQVRYLEDEEVPVLARAFLNDWDRKFENLTEPERFQLIKKEIKIHVPFVKTMIKEILATLQKDDQGKIKNWNRGIIFVPSIAHADIYAFLLSRLSPNGSDRIVAKPFHSGLAKEVRENTMDWFLDQQKRSSNTRRYAEQTLKQEIHKYLIAIRTIGEGFDDPRVNHIILAKPYSEDDSVGMRELLQNLGRGARLAYSKPSFSISDFTGDMKRLIFDGLDQSFINKFFVENGEKDFSEPPRPIEEPARVRITEAVLDVGTMKTKGFETSLVDVPVDHLANNNRDEAEIETIPAKRLTDERPQFSHDYYSWSNLLHQPEAWELLFGDILPMIRDGHIFQRLSIAHLMTLSRTELRHGGDIQPGTYLSMKELLDRVGLKTKFGGQKQLESLALKQIGPLSQTLADNRPEVNRELLRTALGVSEGWEPKLLTWGEFIHRGGSLRIVMSGEVSVRTLELIGNSSLADLLRMSEAELLSIYGLGRKTLGELRLVLQKLGLKLADEELRQFSPQFLSELSLFRFTPDHSGYRQGPIAPLNWSVPVFEELRLAFARRASPAPEYITWGEFIHDPMSFQILLGEHISIPAFIGTARNRISLENALRMSEIDWRKVPNLGSKSLNEIHARFKELGLKMAKADGNHQFGPRFLTSLSPFTRQHLKVIRMIVEALVENENGARPVFLNQTQKNEAINEVLRKIGVTDIQLRHYFAPCERSLEN